MTFGMQSKMPALTRKDRLSELPYVLLIHILSLLPRKDAVKTSALSTTWRNLWKSRYSHNTMLTFGRPYQNEDDQSLIASEVGTQLLALGGKKIETFKLYFYPGNKYNLLTSEWIQRAVLNGVEELYLDFSQGLLIGRLEGNQRKFEIMDFVFESNKRLTILSLSYCQFPRCFDFQYFSTLETLYLHGTNLKDCMFNKLMNCCSRLKSLELRQCLTLHSVKISSTQCCLLQNLSIVGCRGLESVIVFGSSLQSFSFYGRVPGLFCLPLNIPSLKRVIIMMLPAIRPASGDMKFGNVEVLSLGDSAIELLLGSCTPLPLTFQYVRELHLSMRGIDLTKGKFSMIFSFFCQCQFPLLEKLFIELSSFSTNMSEYKQNGELRVVFSHLRVIKISKFSCRLIQMRLLGFLMDAAVNLEEIILILSRSSTTNGMMVLHHMLTEHPNLRKTVVFEDDQSVVPLHSHVIAGFSARVPQLNGPME